MASTQTLTNTQVQDLIIIEAKIEWQLAYEKGDTAGMNAAAAKANQARSAGGTIPSNQSLTQDMFDAYQAFKASGGALEAGLFGGIPTWALIGVGGLLLMGFLRGRK